MKNLEFSLFPLEARQLLSVEVSNFSSDDLVVVPGQSVTLAVDVFSSSGQAEAATFYRDMNNNGQWDPGIDRDLGASTSRIGNRFFRTVNIGDWSGPLNIVADGTNSAGEWAASRQSLQMRLNHSPHFVSFSLIDEANGTSAGAIARPADDSGHIRAVTFFLDRNNNGVWDDGLDTSLGTVFTPDADGSYRMNFSPDPASWPRNPFIVADAVDEDGDWSNDRRWGAINYHDSSLSPPPATYGYEVSQDWASTDGHTMTLSVNATDNSAVRAVTFYIDYDNNGQWTPDADESLGTVYRSSGGDRYSLDVSTDFAGRSDVHILADVTDYDGQWMPARPSVVAQNGATGFVSEFDAHLVSGTTVDFDMTFNFEHAFNRDIPSSATYFIFLDSNRDGHFDAQVDPIITTRSVAVNVDGVVSEGARVDVGANYHNDNMYGLGLTNVGNSVIVSPIRVTVQRVDSLVDQPRITTFDAELGSHTEFPVIGSHYQLRGNWEAPRGGSVVAFFFDRNLNGHWDQDTDVDLGARFISGTSGSFVFNGHVLPTMLGFGAFTAVVRDRSSGPEAWSVPVSDGVVQIFAHPSIINVSPSTLIAPAGSTFDFDLTFESHRHIRAATAFLDVNNDGMLGLPDLNYTDTAFNLTHGNRNEGSMRLSINTAGLAPGTYTVYFAVGDNYRGHGSLPGGEANGFWSQRYALQITLT